MSNKAYKQQENDERETSLRDQVSDASESVDVNPDDNDVSTESEDAELLETEALMKQLNDTKAQLEKEKKEYLFLMAEFDNFRKRTLKEKSDIIKNGAEAAMKGLLPIIDDFERGLAAINESSDAEVVKEGMQLIYNKLVKYLEQNGVKVIPTDGEVFDTEYHEAVAMVPTDDESLRGKIIDTVSKGYTMNDKVIRHAKVAVAQ